MMSSVGTRLRVAVGSNHFVVVGWLIDDAVDNSAQLVNVSEDVVEHVVVLVRVRRKNKGLKEAIVPLSVDVEMADHLNDDSIAESLSAVDLDDLGGASGNVERGDLSLDVSLALHGLRLPVDER